MPDQNTSETLFKMETSTSTRQSPFVFYKKRTNKLGKLFFLVAECVTPLLEVFIKNHVKKHVEEDIQKFENIPSIPIHVSTSSLDQTLDDKADFDLDLTFADSTDVQITEKPLSQEEQLSMFSRTEM